MKKSWTNTDIAELLRDIAAAYQLTDEKKNKFRIVSYQRAADGIEHASSDVKDLWEQGNLDDVPGIGDSIKTSLDELFRTGTSKHFDSVLKPIPQSVFQLMRVPGIGPKTAYKLVMTLKLPAKDPFDALEADAKAGKIATLEGFGEKSQQDIITALSEYKIKKPSRRLLSEAQAIANDVIAWMETNPHVKASSVLGSLRRKASTIGDIDIAVSTDDSKSVLTHFTKYPKASRVIEIGEHSSSILLPGNIQVDCKTQEPSRYGALLQHFTGSKHHNIALRELALKQGYSLSEYGIKKVGKETIKAFPDEKSFYAFLGLEWIPPELREDSGEIQAAKSETLPNLLELSDIKGDLHMHSDFDIETSHDVGENSMKEYIESASKLNYEYIAFTEHNPSQKGHTDSQIYSLLSRKREKIESLNDTFVKPMKKSIKKVFNSLEIDIKPDGSLPVSEHSLELLDFALVSIHSSFRMNRVEMTKRVLTALSFPKVKIFAHPTGRLLGSRDSIDLDWEKVFEVCLQKHIYLEINADPHRLDLPDSLVHDALSAGVSFSIGTDSHSILGLHNMPYGVSVARRGWLTKKNVITTYPLSDFEDMIK
jgi:DNA polymerase (family 10)